MVLLLSRSDIENTTEAHAGRNQHNALFVLNLWHEKHENVITPNARFPEAYIGGAKLFCRPSLSADNYHEKH